MVIQKLDRDPSVLSQILGGLGQGLGQGIPQGVESNALQQILSKSDFTNNPQGFIEALLGSNLSPQTQQRGLSALQAGQQFQQGQQQLQQGQQNLEESKFRQQQEKSQLRDDMISQFSEQYGVSPEHTRNVVGDTFDVNVAKERMEKSKRIIDVSTNAFTEQIRKGGYSTDSQRSQLSKMAKRMDAASPGSARAVLNEAGITQPSEQAKILFSLSNKEKTALSSIPSMLEAQKVLASGADIQAFNLMDTAISKAQRAVKAIVSKDMSPELIIQELFDKGFTEEDIVKIFEPIIDQLTPAQQEAFYGFEREKTGLGKIFSGVKGLFGGNK